MKLVQALFETPQLGVAEWSPVAAIENEHYAAMVLQKIAGGDLFAGGVQQGEGRCLRANRQGGVGGWDQFAEVDHAGNEEGDDGGTQHAEDGAADFAAILRGIAECTPDADEQQC